MAMSGEPAEGTYLDVVASYFTGVRVPLLG
jgi:hypothetical protein